MKNKKAKGNNAIIIIIILALAIGAYFYFNKTTTQPDMVSVKLYDANMNEINQNQFSIVNGIPNVVYASFIISVKNLDSVNLNLDITSMTPASAISIKPTNTLPASPGQIVQWATPLLQINTSTYQGYTTNFCFNVTSQIIPNVRNMTSIQGCQSLTITADNLSSASVANFSVNVTGGGSGGINTICNESWTCTNFSSCVSGTQTRTCGDSNNCGTYNNRPTLTQPCVTIPFTKGAYCTPSGIIGYTKGTLPACIITLDANSDGVLDTFQSYGVGLFPNSGSCSLWGQLSTIYTTPEGYSVRYSPSLLPPRIYICSSTDFMYAYLDKI